jgi:hypothetical protein
VAGACGIRDRAVAETGILRIFLLERLRIQKAGRKVVVPVKLNIVERSGDAVPAGRSSGFRAANVRHGGHDDISAAQRFSDENDLQFNGSAGRQLPGAKKIDARRANVAGDKSDRKFFGHPADSAETQREPQRGTRVLPMFGMNTHSMCGNADEAARLGGAKKRRKAQRGHSQWFGNRLWPYRRVANFHARFGWPRFEWSCALCGAHLTLRDDTSLSLAKAQQAKQQKSIFLELPRPHGAVWSDKMALEEADVNLWKTEEVS